MLKLLAVEVLTEEEEEEERNTKKTVPCRRKRQGKKDSVTTCRNVFLIKCHKPQLSIMFRYQNMAPNRQLVLPKQTSEKIASKPRNT